jgi:hypothetical protein
MIPHDLGAPTEDPWYRVNAYLHQDTGCWKDLNPKFVLQVYRDHVLTGDRDFLKEVWEPVRKAMESMEQFDLDEDGLIENEGYPDQTYDAWEVGGPSAYTGGLWLAALGAAAAMADLLGEEAQAKHYRDWLERGKASYEELLWNGDYYDYDAGRGPSSTSIMADQLAGQWYARACGLPSIVPEANALREQREALRTGRDRSSQRDAARRARRHLVPPVAGGVDRYDLRAGGGDAPGGSGQRSLGDGQGDLQRDVRRVRVLVPDARSVGLPGRPPLAGLHAPAGDLGDPVGMGAAGVVAAPVSRCSNSRPGG